jgi:hypothetical protein
MKTLKAIALGTVAAMALVPTVSSAQVVNDIENLVYELNQDVANRANLAAINLAAIDGGVNISVTGANGGTTSTITDGSSIANNVVTNATDNSSLDIQSGTGSWASAGVGSSSDLDASAVVGVIGGSDGTGSGDISFDWSQSQTNIDNTITDTTLTTTATSDAATSSDQTTFDIGDVTTAALGAVNSGDIDMTEAAGTVDTASLASTSTTSASADYASAIGSGNSAMSMALNLADIDGAVTATINGGSGSLGNVSTTAAGAINSGSIIANVVGVNPGTVTP